MYRALLKREIDKVQEGGDPINVYRDPDHPTVDTNHTVQMGEWAENARNRRHSLAPGGRGLGEGDSLPPALRIDS
jgi:hypothetical protein